MYISDTHTHTSVKEEIIQQFSCTTVPLRVLIVTIAFRMGVNPPDVWYVLHCGPHGMLKCMSNRLVVIVEMTILPMLFFFKEKDKNNTSKKG